MGHKNQTHCEQSFHLVAQKESRLIQQDSFSMHALAVISLLFLPIVSVASFLDTPFFEVGEKYRIELFYGPLRIVWIVGGLSALVVLSWLSWYWLGRRRLQ